MIKYIELPIKEYIQEIINKGNMGIKVYISGEKGAPIFKSRYDLYLEDGIMFSFNTWSQFIASVYQFSCKGVVVNFNKTWNAFEKQNPQALNKTIIVDYFEHRSTVQQYLDKIPEEEVSEAFSIEYVIENQKGKKAVEFKIWLKGYLEVCEVYDYVVDFDKGVSKIIKELQNMEENK